MYESHWNPKARSPTGVRGIMMLTLNTARAMGVDSRLDPRQSIFGGAKYLAKMKKRYYQRLKYGYARGMEPVRYVQRIREYKHILANEWQ